jgi:hypothetical protein
MISYPPLSHISAVFNSRENDAFPGYLSSYEKNGLNPIPVVSGRSASAAAALGWYHALNGTIPDDRVIVLAQINSQGVLVQVDEKSIPAKVKAIVDYGYFDTIAVAGKADEAVALKALPQGISIRVKNLDSDGIT